MKEMNLVDQKNTTAGGTAKCKVCNSVFKDKRTWWSLFFYNFTGGAQLTKHIQDKGHQMHYLM